MPDTTVQITGVDGFTGLDSTPCACNCTCPSKYAYGQVSTFGWSPFVDVGSGPTGAESDADAFAAFFSNGLEDPANWEDDACFPVYPKVTYTKLIDDGLGGGPVLWTREFIHDPRDGVVTSDIVRKQSTIIYRYLMEEDGDTVTDDGSGGPPGSIPADLGNGQYQSYMHPRYLPADDTPDLVIVDFAWEFSTTKRWWRITYNTGGANTTDEWGIELSGTPITQAYVEGRAQDLSELVDLSDESATVMDTTGDYYRAMYYPDFLGDGTALDPYSASGILMQYHRGAYYGDRMSGTDLGVYDDGAYQPSVMMGVDIAHTPGAMESDGDGAYGLGLSYVYAYYGRQAVLRGRVFPEVRTITYAAKANPDDGCTNIGTGGTPTSPAIGDVVVVVPPGSIFTPSESGESAMLHITCDGSDYEP